MPLAPASGAAIGLILLVLADVRLWAARSRRRAGAPVSEVDARARTAADQAHPVPSAR
jgi:hypothetical protein